MDTIFFEAEEEVPKTPSPYIWYHVKVLNILFGEQKELAK